MLFGKELCAAKKLIIAPRNNMKDSVWNPNDLLIQDVIFDTIIFLNCCYYEYLLLL